MALLSQFRRKAKADLVELTESTFTSIPQGAIDREAGIMRGVKIIGRHSKRGREYSEAALQEAAPQYEGAPVCLDHMPQGRGADVRSIRDTWGVLRNVEVRGDGAYGDLHYLKEHAETGAILERAEKGIPMGLSHNARGKSSRVGGREIVESIRNVFSVDLVSRPATTTNLFESEGPIVKTTLKELIESTGYTFTDELIEMLPEEVDPMAAVEMEEEPAEKANPVEAVKQALADEAVKIFLDPAIDAAETGKKVKDLAKAAEDVANKVNPAEKPAEESGEGEEEEEEKKVEESLPAAVSKQLKELTESFARTEKKLAAREFLESRKLDPAKVGAERLKSLTECDDEAAMVKLVESWPPVLRGAAPPVVASGANAKPRVAPRLINARRS